MCQKPVPCGQKSLFSQSDSSINLLGNPAVSRQLIGVQNSKIAFLLVHFDPHRVSTRILDKYRLSHFFRSVYSEKCQTKKSFKYARECFRSFLQFRNLLLLKFIIIWSYNDLIVLHCFSSVSDLIVSFSGSIGKRKFYWYDRFKWPDLLSGRNK